MKAPAIIVYKSFDVQPREDKALFLAGSKMQFAAAIVPSGPGTHWMSTGETAEEATEKLLAMWAKQFPGPSKRGAHLRKTPDNPAITEPESVDDSEIII